MSISCSNIKILHNVPQSTQSPPAEGACIVIEDPEQLDRITSPTTQPLTEDASTQCCVGARFVLTRSSSTQTDPVDSTPVPLKTFTDAGTQVEISDVSPDCAEPGPSGNSNHVKGGVINLSYQQTARNCAKFDKKKQGFSGNENTESAQPKVTLFEQVYPSDEESSNGPPLSPLALKDDDEEYKCDMTDDTGCYSDDNDVESESEKQTEQTFLVFESCLKLLLKFCSKCGEAIFESKETTSGSMFSVKMQCVNNHLTSWNSQPLIKNTAAGNLLASAAILFSGNTFSHIAQFASFLNMKFFSHTTYYNIQKKYLFPTVNKAWIEERSSVLDEIKSNGPVNLIGDGQCDRSQCQILYIYNDDR